MTQTEKQQSNKFIDWINGDYAPQEAGRMVAPAARPKAKQKMRDVKSESLESLRSKRKLATVAAILAVVLMTLAMLMTVAELPEFGSADSPVFNEVYDRYVEHGLDETGATNLVGGLILNYRAFDTYGEATVLFIAMTAIVVLLKPDEKYNPPMLQAQLTRERAIGKRYSSIVLNRNAVAIFPFIALFAIYVMFNGHLSPGGGFSGGTILGAAMILFELAFGVDRLHKFFDDHVYHVVKIGALTIYGAIMIYFIYMGANGWDNHVPLGIFGNIVSSGFIMPINVLVGFEVACTVYGFYAVFSRGEI